MRPLLALSLLLLSAPAFGASPLAEPGQVYTGGTRVRIPELWVSFVVPKDMKGGLTEEAFVMGSDTKPAIVIGVGDRGLSLAQVKAVFSQPLPLDGMTVLQPAGAPTVKGRTVKNRYSVQTANGTLVGLSEAKILKNGAAVGFISLAPDAKAAGRRLRRVMKTVRVEKRPPAPKPGQASGSWAKRLPGNTLLYMKTANGLSTKTRIELCRNGQFIYYSHDNYMSGGFSSVAQGGNQGTWSLRGGTLTLTWANGNVDRRTLRAEGGKTFVDGTRWFVTDGACGGR